MAMVAVYGAERPEIQKIERAVRRWNFSARSLLEAASGDGVGVELSATPTPQSPRKNFPMDERLTKLTGSMLAAVRDQVECLIDRGDVNSAQLKVLLNPEARKLAVEALKAQGKTQDQIAKKLGVSQMTVGRDLAETNVSASPKKARKTTTTIKRLFLESSGRVGREENRIEIEAHNEALAAIEVLEPIQTFETIVLDPALADDQDRAGRPAQSSSIRLPNDERGRASQV